MSDSISLRKGREHKRCTKTFKDVEICTGEMDKYANPRNKLETRGSLGYPSSIILTSLFTTYWTGSFSKTDSLL